MMTRPRPDTTSDVTRASAAMAAAVTAAAAISSPSRLSSRHRPTPAGRKPVLSDGATASSTALSSRIDATTMSSSARPSVRKAAIATTSAPAPAPPTSNGLGRRRATWAIATALSTPATATKLAASTASARTTPGAERAAVAAAIEPGSANPAPPQPASAARGFGVRPWTRQPSAPDAPITAPASANAVSRRACEAGRASAIPAVYAPTAKVAPMPTQLSMSVVAVSVKVPRPIAMTAPIRMAGAHGRCQAPGARTAASATPTTAQSRRQASGSMIAAAAPRSRAAITSCPLPWPEPRVTVSLYVVRSAFQAGVAARSGAVSACTPLATTTTVVTIAATPPAI